MSQKIGEKSFTKQIENFSESIDISRKKITKIGEILFIENYPQKIGEKSFTKKSENFSEPTQIFIKKITKIGDILLIENVSKIGENSMT